MFPGSFMALGAWRDFKNTDASMMPAFGVGIITDVVASGLDELVYRNVAQPSAFGDPLGLCVINGPSGIASDAYGRCTRADEVVALYDPGTGTPENGQMWGPTNASWKLSKNGIGFLCLGAPTNADMNIALFRPLLTTTFRGTIAADAAPDSNNTVTVYTGAYGSEATATFTVPNVRNASDCTLKSGSGVKVHRIVYDPQVQGWEFDVGRTS
jgi:hypothetical protein